MDEKIYKLVMIRRKTRSYYDLSQEEQKRLEAQIEQIRADVGAKLASPVYNSIWSNEQVSAFYSYFHSEIIVGVRAEQPI